MSWDIFLDVIDAAMDDEYVGYFVAHPFPRLIDLEEPIPTSDEDDDDEDGGGGP